MFIKKWFSHINKKKWHSHIHQTKRAKFLKFRSHRTCWDMFSTVCLATSWHCCPRKGYCTQQAIYGQWTSWDIWAKNHRTWCFPAWKYRGAHHFTTLNEVHPPGVEALGERDKRGGPESVPQSWDKSRAPRPQWQQVEDDARGDVPTSVRASGLSFSSFLSSLGPMPPYGRLT